MTHQPTWQQWDVKKWLIEFAGQVNLEQIHSLNSHWNIFFTTNFFNDKLLLNKNNNKKLQISFYFHV